MEFLFGPFPGFHGLLHGFKGTQIIPLTLEPNVRAVFSVMIPGDAGVSGLIIAAPFALFQKLNTSTLYQMQVLIDILVVLPLAAAAADHLAPGQGVLGHVCLIATDAPAAPDCGATLVAEVSEFQNREPPKHLPGQIDHIHMSFSNGCHRFVYSSPVQVSALPESFVKSWPTVASMIS